MAKRDQGRVLNRLAGKKLVFSGRFSYGVEARLKAMAEAQQGTVHDDLDDKVDYLVLADLGTGKTIQKKVVTLNARGATIQVIDVDRFKGLADPTEDEVLALLRAGEAETYAKVHEPTFQYSRKQPAKYTFHSQELGGVRFQNAHLLELRFDGCGFTGATLEHTTVAAATDCDFSKVVARDSQFVDVPNCRFNDSTLIGCRFVGDFSAADFTRASLEESSFSDMFHYHLARAKKPVQARRAGL